MLTGEIPFQGESGMQQMFQRVNSVPVNPKSLNPDMPDYLVRIIQRCLEKDPERRYQNAAEILKDLTPEEAPVPNRQVRLRFVENVYAGWLPAVRSWQKRAGRADHLSGGAAVSRGGRRLQPERRR